MTDGLYPESTYLTTSTGTGHSRAGAWELASRISGARADAKYQTHAPVDGLTEDIMQELRSIVDDEYACGPKKGDEYIKIPIFHTVLAYIATIPVTDRLWALFEGAGGSRGLWGSNDYGVMIFVSRDARVGKGRDWHVNTAPLTMRVALNSDAEYEGGVLSYVCGETFDAPTRSAGTVTIHDNGTVHGVTPLRRGVKYELAFVNQ